MESCHQPDYGGHDCEFVDQLPDHLSCIVCLTAFKEPHLLSCCGQKVCFTCITFIKNGGQPCPHCREHNFITMLDKDFNRQVLNRKVYCYKKHAGCDWIGDLRHLEDHSRECNHVEVNCSWNCGQKIVRHKLREHEEDECLLRPVELKLKRSVDKMQEQLDNFKIIYKEQRQQIECLEDKKVKAEERHKEEKKWLEERLERQQEEVKRLVMKMDEKRKNDVDQWRQSNAEQQNDLNKLRQQVKQDTIKQVEPVLTGLKKMEEKQKKDLQQFQQEFNAKQKQLNTLAEQVRQFNHQVEPFQADVRGTRKLYADLEEKLEKETGMSKKRMDKIEASIDNEVATKVSVRVLQENFEKIRRHGLKVPEWQQPLPVAVLSTIAPCQFTMHNFSVRKSDERTWYSPPFFNEPGGYKFCLRVDSHGMLEGRATHLSVWVYVMKGLHDEALKWPFTGKVTVQLLNWKEGQNHVQNIIAFDNQAGSKVRQRVTAGEVAPTGRGSSRFVSHETLLSSESADKPGSKSPQYISKDDCLCFRINKIDIS